MVRGPSSEKVGSPDRPIGKSIVLFSDGTGNSSAKLFKTNVWRMYEAVDLGPSPSGYRDQISFYDDGVGTSNFKFLAVLGGAFGWGLERNVLDIYRYACRNYRDGDRIYGFGFSRGAFTIRLVIALIASQGLVQSEDESELERKSREAYRAFRAAFQPRKFKGPTRTARRMRDLSTTYDRSENLDPVISFVGVWDTVSAYGGPIAEITRAIDNWIYPLSMPDYELHERVECARHALAIDDERDAFHPLLWDELAEERRAKEAGKAREKASKKAALAKTKIERAKLKAQAAHFADRERHFRDRMQQVWFTGMHADVGGGYPDESLSYVSLLWMMEEAEKAGLRTLVSIKDRFFALANSYGPMHDSRSGIASYYRYQPRKIAAWLHISDEKYGARYLMLRDPDIRDDEGRVRGLLRCVCVHESVIARINSGTVRYAPIALPESFRVVPPQQEGENIQQPVDTGKAKCRYDRPPSEPLITADTRQRLEGSAGARFACQENLWDLVWRRRLAYFATVAVTLMLVAMPVWSPLPSFVNQTCSDARCVLPSLIRPLGALVPGFLDPWIAAIARYPFTALFYLLGIYFLMRWSSSAEARLFNGSWRVWRQALDGTPIPAKECEESGLRAFREGKPYQKFFRWVKWRALPAVFGLLILISALYVPLVIVTQMVIQVKEADHSFCPADDRARLRSFDRATFDFDTRLPCRSPQIILQKGQVYEVAFQLPVTDQGEPVGWWDANVAAGPGSLTRVPASNLPQVLGVPMRRVIETSYLQPLAHTTALPRPPKAYGWEPEWLRSWRSSFERVRITELDLKPDEQWPELYRARIKAGDDKSLHLFANEVYLPFTGQFYYRNNCGIARVVITKVVPRQRGLPLMDKPGQPIKPPVCALRRLKTEEPSPTVAAKES